MSMCERMCVRVCEAWIHSLPHYLLRNRLVLELGRQVQDGFYRKTLDVFRRNIKEIITMLSHSNERNRSRRLRVKMLIPHVSEGSIS